MNIQYIILDNDGTLYNLEPKFKGAVVREMAHFLSRRLGIPEEQVLKERQKLIEKYRVESTEFVFGREYGIGYDEFVGQTYLLVPIEDHRIIYNGKLQNMLKNIDIPKSILTNNPSEFARKILRSIGIGALFEHVIGSKELDYHLKPDVRAFLRAVEVTGYNPKKTMFVDDTPEFHQPAKELGMTTVLISSEFKKPRDKFVDYEVREIYDINKILKDEQNV